jgi:murein lipoprotein
MTTTTENDLKALKDFIGEQFKQVNGEINKLGGEVNKLNGKIDKLDKGVNELRVDIASVKGELAGTHKRLENLEFTNRAIFVAIVAGLMAGLVQVFFASFPSSP